MGWFGSDGININKRIRLNEGNEFLLGFSLSKTELIDISVKRLDGYGVNVYIMTSDEYRNYCQELLFNVFTDLSFKDIEHFDGNAYLQAGSYYLVAELPQKTDGLDSYGEFAIRCEVVK